MHEAWTSAGVGEGKPRICLPPPPRLLKKSKFKKENVDLLNVNGNNLKKKFALLLIMM
jgi:hypothetical protein